MAEKIDKQLERSRVKRKKEGKALRQKMSFSSHGQWKPAPDRPDPLDHLQAQDKDRIRKLLPIKDRA